MDHTVTLYRVKPLDGRYLVLASPSTLHVFFGDRISFRPAWEAANWSVQFIGGQSPLQGSSSISDTNLRAVVRDPANFALVYNYKVNLPGLVSPDADPQIIVNPRGGIGRGMLGLLVREVAGVVVGVAVAFAAMFLLLQKIIDRRIRVRAGSNGTLE